MDPITRYVDAGGVNIAYQTFGQGQHTLVHLIPLSNIEIILEDPHATAFLRRLAGFCRVICYDKRGTGMSDRRVDAPTLEERAEDVLAVLDAEDVEKATLFGVSEGGSLAAYLGATRPDRVAGAILWGTPSRFVRDEEHPWGWAPRETVDDLARAMADSYGDPDAAREMAAILVPSMVGDERFETWYAKWARHSVSRDAIAGQLRVSQSYDLADVFPSLRVPTMVMQRDGDLLCPVAQGRRLAEVIPDAHYVELAGDDHLPHWGDTEPVLVEIEQFVTGRRADNRGERRLVTLLMTDISGSTAVAEEMGDGPWRALLARFDDITRVCISRFAGQEIKQTGDGFLVAFDGPARAINCAMAIADSADRMSLSVHTGIHTGECEVRDDDVSGIAVHVAARLTDTADAGQILASGTVKDLVAGSGIRFGDGTEVELRGLAGTRVVHEVLQHGTSPSAVRSLTATKTARWSCEGEYWTVAFDGNVATVRGSAGMHDLARLLEQPNRELHVLDLASGSTAASLARSTPAAILDEQAKEQYRQRLLDLEAEINEAATHNDDERVARLGAERDQLVDELARAYGLAGRTRGFDEEGERARKAVSKRIRTAIARLDDLHDQLARHLRTTIHTGTYCAYIPDPIVHWDVKR